MCVFKDKEFYYNPDTYLPQFQREMFNEEDQDRDAWWIIHENDLVIDVGAGTGSWAIPAAAMGGNVIAFECDPYRIAALKENVKCNPRMQMTIDSRGLYSRVCEMGMDMNSSSVMLQLGYNPQQRVKMTTLDKFYADYNLDRCNIIKVDVEGAELHVLAGATETIRKYKPRIIVECHTFIIPDIDGMVLSFLNRLGLFYKTTCVLRTSKPGAIDLRSYNYPRLYAEIESTTK